MTVFVGVRNNYLIWRCGVHASCSIFAAILAVGGIALAASSPKRMVALAPAVVLVSKKGRSLTGKCIKEVHDGVLFSTFGVFQTDSNKKGASS